MGTRHLTAVYLNHEYKVAQYGQWDGYPDGQGITCLHFLREECDIARFRDAVKNCTFIANDKLNGLLKEFGMEDNGDMSVDDYDRFKLAYPELHRDIGAKILKLVQDNPEGLELRDRIEFAADSLMCEWAWVVDLDEGTFEAYKGYNYTPLTENDRFFFLAEYEDERDFGGGMAHGVKLVAKWSLDKLPTDEEFLATFRDDEEDDDETSL